MKRTRSDYKICEICGASLDIGEKCDCQQTKPYNKVSACIYPFKYGCKNCEHNSVINLYDGGCILAMREKAAP